MGRVQTPTLSIVVEREEKIPRTCSATTGKSGPALAPPKVPTKASGSTPTEKNEQDPEAKADRVWSAAEAKAIAETVDGQPGTVTEESKPSNQSSPAV